MSFVFFTNGLCYIPCVSYVFSRRSAETGGGKNSCMLRRDGSEAISKAFVTHWAVPISKAFQFLHRCKKVLLKSGGFGVRSPLARQTFVMLGKEIRTRASEIPACRASIPVILYYFCVWAYLSLVKYIQSARS